MAAETPQIDTAVESMAANSSSTRSFRQSQKHAYQTTNTTSTACRMPSAPACSTSMNSKARAEDHQTDLDEEFGLHRGLEPLRRSNRCC